VLGMSNMDKVDIRMYPGFDICGSVRCRTIAALGEHRGSLRLNYDIFDIKWVMTEYHRISL
jgi:hypothetical protein